LKANPVFIEEEGGWGCVGCQSWCGRAGEKKDFLPLPGIELCFLGCTARSMYNEDRAICKSAAFRLIELFSVSLVNLCQLTTYVYNHVTSRCINERE
jgi:hypothetical protein